MHVQDYSNAVGLAFCENVRFTFFIWKMTISILCFLSFRQKRFKCNSNEPIVNQNAMNTLDLIYLTLKKKIILSIWSCQKPLHIYLLCVMKEIPLGYPRVINVTSLIIFNTLWFLVVLGIIKNRSVCEEIRIQSR